MKGLGFELTSMKGPVRTGKTPRTRLLGFMQSELSVVLCYSMHLFGVGFFILFGGIELVGEDWVGGKR